MTSLSPSYLLPNTKTAEDQVQNIVCGGLAGDGIQRTQGSVEIQHDHLVRNAAGNGILGGSQAGERLFHQSLMTDVGQEPGFVLARRMASKSIENFCPQLVDTLSGQGGCGENLEAIRCRQTGLTQV